MQEARWYNKWLLRKFDNSLKGEVLEVGAGIGNFTALLVERYKLTAIDINKDYVKKLKKRYKSAKIGLGNIATGNYFFKNKKFDSIICLNVLEHIKDDKKALVHIYRLLKPKGVFVLLVPAQNILFSRFDKQLGHFRRYNKKSLEKKLSDAGFQIEKTDYVNWWAALGWLFLVKLPARYRLSSLEVKIFDRLARIFLWPEKYVKIPFGLSVLAIAKKKKKMKMKKLTIIVPVFNEEKTIKKILAEVSKSLKQQKKIKENKIIVVDDGSRDQSVKEIKKAKKDLNLDNLELLVHKKNKGKGAAIRTALKKIDEGIIIIQDADLEYSPKDYKRLTAPIIKGESEVVYGTRLKNYPLKLFGQNQTPLVLHYLGNKFLTFVTNFLYDSELTDMETCYKVFTKAVIRDISLQANRFEFEPEITAKFLKIGVKIKEVPIKVKPRGYDEGKKITWRDGFIAIWTLIKYKFSD